MSRYSFLIVLLITVSCGKRVYPVLENKTLVDITNELQEDVLLGENINFFFLKCEDSFVENYGIAAIYANTLNDLKTGDYYINSPIYLSWIYSFPPSYYFIYKDKPVLVYARKEGFANPNLYTQAQTELFAKYLMDDWNYYYQSTEKSQYPLESWDGWYRGNTDFIMRHPDKVKVKKNIPQVIKYFEFDAYDYTQPNENYNFYQDLKIEELRLRKADTIFLK
ncbi:hypothetical protein [Gilvibacter sediminis]|uniref:hypothetical protein n=1 Tax=Gilvibacter sediminis TaxID=379071 RepID=UPI00235016AD|nr:hypothetical protein [Gilvibacter sediminis]MDC7999041.1 hypothetical protein [Gilvibacter sediminis]